MHSKKSIYILVRISGITSHALIDCGATDNFINLAFMRKKKLQPVPLDQARVCRLGEVIREVTHGFQSQIEVGSKRLPVDFYVMNGKSNQGIVQGYSFLTKNDASINFKNKELQLGGMNVHCLNSQFEEIADANIEGDPKGMKELGAKWQIMCPKEYHLLPGDSCYIELLRCPKEWTGRQVESKKSVSLACGKIELHKGGYRMQVENKEERLVKLRIGFTLRYMQKIL